MTAIPTSHEHLNEWKSLLKHIRCSIGESLSTDDSHYFEQALSDLDIYFKCTVNEFCVEQKKFELLQGSSRLFGNFFLEAPIGYLILSTEGIIEDVNYAASDFWAIGRNRMRGLGLFGLVSSHDVSVLSKALDAAAMSDHRKTVDIKCVRPGGSNFWGRFDIIKTAEGPDDKRRLLCSVSDITSDRILDDAIKRTAVGLSGSTEKSFFTHLTNFLTGYPNIDFALVSKKEGNGTYQTISVCGESAEVDNFEYDGPQEEDASDRYHVADGHHKVNTLNTILKTKYGLGVFLLDSENNVAGELVILTKEGLRNNKLYSSVLKVLSSRASAELQRLKAKEELTQYRDQLEGLVERRTLELKSNNQKLSQEIEKRKSIEINLREAKYLAEEATKTKSAFLANMSHEIRTPINGIIGVIPLMERLTDDPKMQTYLKIIDESGSTLLHILNDILDISKLESGRLNIEKKRFDLRELMISICRPHYLKTQSKNIFLILDYPLDHEECIISDKLRVRQVIDNLLSNAIKFTSKGHVILKVRT